MTLDTTRNKVVFRIELRDRSFNILELNDNLVSGIDFDYSRIGGCGDFKFTLPRKYCDEKYISGGFNVRIYIWNEETKVFDLWYQGLVEEKVPTVQGVVESIDVIGHGYQAQLGYIQLSGLTYTNQELSVVVKNILDNYILPATDITYDLADIESTGFTANNLKFDTDAQSALQTIADIAGTREWGIDRNRKFFFKARSSTPGFYFPIGKNVINFQEDQSFKDIINRVLIQGGDIDDGMGGTIPYQKTYNSTISQLKYGRRDRIYQSSSVTTDPVSSQLANSLFNDYSDVVRKATCDLINYKNRVETTLPIPLFVLIAESAITYGTNPYGTFLYSGLINRQINRISYTIDSQSVLAIKLDLGDLLPDDANFINRLQYTIEQIRSSGL